MTHSTVRLEHNAIHVGERFSVSFQRTLRIPDDGQVYPLPPGLDHFPLHRVVDFAETVPEFWLKTGGFFIPLYQREALWIQFSAKSWKPNAVLVGVGGINAVTGDPFSLSLHEEPQNYITCPEQLWLDGINAGDEIVRQFVAVALGSGYSVESQLTGSDTTGGIQMTVLKPHAGIFPDQPPIQKHLDLEDWLEDDGLESFDFLRGGDSAETELAIGAGGQLKQKIYTDPHGIDTWDVASAESFTIYIVNSQQYQAITGQAPPLSPVSAALYQQAGLPWFDLYDEDKMAVEKSAILEKIKSVRQKDEEDGRPLDPDDQSLPVDQLPIQPIKPVKNMEDSHGKEHNQ